MFSHEKVIRLGSHSKKKKKIWNGLISHCSADSLAGPAKNLENHCVQKKLQMFLPDFQSRGSLRLQSCILQQQRFVRKELSCIAFVIRLVSE